jgi:hypothetical protein
MLQIPKSTSRVVMLKLFLSSDHVTAATGKTVAVKISKAGGAFADPNAGATNATEVGNGWYKVTLDTTDTNAEGDLVVRGTAASCDDAERVFAVVKATNGGLTALPDAAAEAAGGLFTRGSGAGQVNQSANGQIDVNTVAMAANVITATAIAADAIGSSELAASAVDEIVDAVWDEATSGHATAGTTGKLLTDIAGYVDTEVAAIKVQTDKLSFDGSNNLNANVQAMANNVVTSAAIAADAIGASELAADVVNDIWMGTALTESYAADGSAFTPAQALYQIWSAVAEFSVSGTNLVCRKLDGTTQSMAFTLDSASAPTSRTRSA